ncbi:hypothetical protein [Roseateles koreensis]|uniref:DUF4064 domain-containing protein n=1 Tax=Roseateles koreensis TaxID=2987526 RepID=A0ABT5KPY3_9BURK|nr:hypothetical protein [Roseateles koreensis]MDC8784980.1 hypothetical protein [Roseateles koreensis]
MKTTLKLILLIGLCVALTSALTGGLLWHFASSSPDFHLTINGQEFTQLSEFKGMAGGLLGCVIAGLVLCIVLPLALLFSVALPVLILGLVFGALLLAFLGVGGLLFSPLILLALPLFLLARLLRSPKKRTRPASSQAGPASRG